MFLFPERWFSDGVQVIQDMCVTAYLDTLLAW